MLTFDIKREIMDKMQLSLQTSRFDLRMTAVSCQILDKVLDGCHCFLEKKPALSSWSNPAGDFFQTIDSQIK